jgi:hypothetical protein
VLTSGSAENPLQLFVEILTAVDEMHDDELVRMIESIRYPILRFAGSEVKRVQHMERSGEPFASEGVAF